MNIVRKTGKGTLIAPPRPRRGIRQPVTIEALLHWAFQKECASINFDEIAAEAAIGGLPNFGMEYLMIERARLGCKVDGGGRSEPHPDADLVADALAVLPEGNGGQHMALTIAELSRTGERPDCMAGVVPRLVPDAHHLNQHGVISKTSCNSLLPSLFRFPSWQRRTRKRGIVTEHGEHCPGHWVPSANQVARARRTYLTWYGALMCLRDGFRFGPGLTAFEVVSTLPPREPWKKTVDEL